MSTGQFMSQQGPAFDKKRNAQQPEQFPSILNKGMKMMFRRLPKQPRMKWKKKVKYW